MAYEFYSAQTRQVKTAMVLSSATLFLYSVIGRPVEEYIKVPPGQYEIPSSYLIYLFIVTATYFAVSFFVSAKYDSHMAEFPEIGHDTKAMVKLLDRYRSILNQQNTRVLEILTNEFNRRNKNSNNEGLKALLHAAKSGNGANEVDAQSAVDLLETLLNDIEIRERHKEYGQSVGKMAEEANMFFSDLPRKQKELEKKTEGIARFHNHFWEFQLPLSASILSILASFVIFILKQLA